MKSLIITSAVAVLALFGATTQAEARSYSGHSSSRVYISGYRSCGTPIYMERYVVRYKRCGAPVWGYRGVSRPYRYAPHPVRGYHHRPAVCPPPYRPYGGGYRNGGVVIQGSFRL
ncbi:MAG: hypothetical protein Q8Q59_12420 [Luteolibacter sp.]|jgi:hypothetical protein|nr:hypothetical protein [Luteolibacter sp.]